MLIIKECIKLTVGAAVFLIVAVVYFYLAGGSGVINFIVTLILSALASVVLLIVYWSELDELKGNKKYVWPKNKAFWLLAIYFFSPVICNWASVLLRLRGYETVAYYTFDLRYWSLLKTPLLGMLCFAVAKSIKKPRFQLNVNEKTRQTTLPQPTMRE